MTRWTFLFAALLALALAAIAPPARADDPSFLIESITVAGAVRSSDRIVIAETRLREGRTYTEGELRDAMARIQRLPFVIDADFRLGKGTAVGRYVLIITIREMKPFFVTARSATRWSLDDRFEFRPGQPPVKAGSDVHQFRSDELALGTRWFVGAKGVLNLAAQVQGNDRYTMTYSQYDLFGTRASIAAVVSYLQDPGARRRPGPERRTRRTRRAGRARARRPAPCGGGPAPGGGR